MSNQSLFNMFQSKSDSEMLKMTEESRIEIERLDRQRVQIEEAIAMRRRFIAKINTVMSMRRDIENGIDQLAQE